MITTLKREQGSATRFYVRASTVKLRAAIPCASFQVTRLRDHVHVSVDAAVWESHI